MNQGTLDNLLGTSLKNLPLENVESRLIKYKKILQKELKSKGIFFDFHLWVSDEWFCPDGVPGFAIPFYLFNKKLINIQKQKMGFVEGTTEKRILMLMRHELGHAIDNAYSLRKNKKRQLIFGSSQEKYPESYSPQVYSSQYVHYLGDGYAQSHPDEDFAESFAFWLDPQKQWKKRKLSKNVRNKIEFMDELMGSLKNVSPKLKNKYRVDPIEKNPLTLNQYYLNIQKEKKHFSFAKIDKLLIQSFKSKSKTKTIMDKKILNEFNQKVVPQLSIKTGAYHYEIKRALQKVLERAQRLGLVIEKESFLVKSPSIIESNYRYLKENNLLKYYL